jgi:membrane fusion protein, multidrug efflux system
VIRLARSSGGIVLCALLLAPACSKKDESESKPAKRSLQFPVEARAVEARKVEYSVGAVGTVEAFERIQITARVGGVVDKVSFREGDVVKEGKVLAEIEPARFRLQAAAARAAMEKAQAAKADADAGLARREAANSQNPGLIPAEDVATFKTKSLAAAADVSEKRIALERAQLDQRDAYVKAPKGGVIQTRSIETGQYVQPGTVLATLVQRDPLLLRFQVPETEAGRLKTGMAARFRVRDAARDSTSRIVHVSEAADPKSRMVSVTGEIDDPDRQALRPGAFAEVTVQVGEAREAPVIPQTAVRPSEKGFLAYVVEDGVAHERVLTLGLRTADGLVEVKSGVKVGEQLVVRGAEALREGATVKVQP